MSELRLPGKVVLITGAAGGQGTVEAHMLAAEGAVIVVCDVEEERGRIVAEQIKVRHGTGTAVFHKLDVTCEEDWKRTLSITLSSFGTLDVLVNNAGILSPETILETSVKNWDEIISVNTAGTFLGIKQAAPAMRSNGGGSIVNVASVSAMTAGKLAAAYHASKGAVRSLARSAAIQLAKDDIRVNTVFPGPVDTPMIRNTYSLAHIRRFDVEHPMRRMATAEEIAYGVLFLASEDSSYMTGAELVIDGGWTAI